MASYIPIAACTSGIGAEPKGEVQMIEAPLFS